MAPAKIKTKSESKPREQTSEPRAYPRASFIHGAFRASTAEDERRLEHIIDALPA